MGFAYDDIVAKQSVPPAARVNGTVNGTAVNLQLNGFESALVVLNIGTITDGSHAVSIEESATGTGGWSAVTGSRLTSAAPTLTSATNNTQVEIGVRASLGFLRVNIVTTGATTGGIVGVTVVGYNPGNNPVDHT